MRMPRNKITSDIELHLFICTNERINKNKSCGKSGSLILFKYLKQRIKSVSQKHSKIVKVNACGCLSNCANGPVAVCYPQGDWFSIKSNAEIDILINYFERKWMEELNSETEKNYCRG